MQTSAKSCCASAERCSNGHLHRSTKQEADGRQFYHFVQSFSVEDGLTPRQVNTIGVEFTQRQFPDFEVVVATHLDTNHPHNHLVVNSVSCKGGKKLHQNAADLQRRRQVNNEICMMRGLQALELPEMHTRKKQMRPGEYQARLRGDSWKLDLIQAINDALEICQRRIFLSLFLCVIGIVCL